VRHIKNTRRWLTSLSLAAIAASIFTACAPARVAAPPTSAPARVGIKVVNLPFIAFAPFYIGIEEGLYQAQGLDVELVNFANQPDTIPAFVAGQVDVVSGQVSAGMFNLIARGAEARFVADKGYIDAQGCDNIALLARRNLVAPGAPVTGDFLRSTKINVVTGSWNEYLADKLLASLGMTTTDFADNPQIPSTSALGAMDTGQIDLIVQNEPWVTRLTAAGATSILSPPHEVVPDAESAIMMFGPKLLGANAEVGNRFMVAYLASVRRYNQGKTDRNVAILAQYTQLGPALLRQMCWPQLRNDGSMNVESELDFQAWAVRKGLQTSTLSAEQFSDTSFLKVANQRLEGQ
jgi:NitT/TauT family transport system substrate-binding protein